MHMIFYCGRGGQFMGNNLTALPLETRQQAKWITR